MDREIIYRCTQTCPLKKRCFVIKLAQPPREPLQVLLKCPAAAGRDILIIIGERPP